MNKQTDKGKDKWAENLMDKQLDKLLEKWNDKEDP